MTVWPNILLKYAYRAVMPFPSGQHMGHRCTRADIVYSILVRLNSRMINNDIDSNKLCILTDRSAAVFTRPVDPKILAIAEPPRASRLAAATLLSCCILMRITQTKLGMPCFGSCRFGSVTVCACALGQNILERVNLLVL